jgi:hypothetical protein
VTSVSLFRLCMRTPLPSLRVTFDDITSGQKAPLGWILCNFRLRIPKGTPFGALPVALSVMCTFCTTTIVVVQNVPVVHVHAITSSSGQGHFRLHMRSLPVAPQPQIWLELYPYTTDTHRVTPVTNPLSCYSRHKPYIVLLSLQTLSCYSRYKPSVVLLPLQTLRRVTPVTNPPSCYSRYKPSDKSWMRKERIRLWLQQTEHIQNINSNKILEDIDIANIYIFDCFFLCLYQSIDGL